MTLFPSGKSTPDPTINRKGNMSTSSVSSTSTSSLYSTSDTSSSDSIFAQIKKDFQTLSKALESGDTSAAKSAYAQLKADKKTADANRPDASSSSSSSSSSSDSDPIDSLMNTLGSEINSGDLTSASSTWSQIQSDFKAHRPPGPPPSSSSSTSSSDSSSNSYSSSVGNYLNVSA